jgi:tryptophan synthase alpha subunit
MGIISIEEHLDEIFEKVRDEIAKYIVPLFGIKHFREPVRFIELIASGVLVTYKENHFF